MKKILFGILTFLGIGLSFCSADTIFIGNWYSTAESEDNIISLSPGDSLNIGNDWTRAGNAYYLPTYYNGTFYENSPISSLTLSSGDYFMVCAISKYNGYISITYSDNTSCVYDSNSQFDSLTCCSSVNSNNSSWTSFSYRSFKNRQYTFFYNSQGGGSSTPSTSDIDVYYNNGNSVENITCDGTQAIQINGLSTITSTNTFTPYYNISYTDEDNQKLTESYSNSILYLENGLFKKTYTGNNDWILTVQGSSDSTFTGYIPVFDVTGTINENTGNIFNNFTDNALTVLLSNIPSYVQWITLIAVLMLLLSFVRRFRRGK